MLLSTLVKSTDDEFDSQENLEEWSIHHMTTNIELTC